MAFIPRIPPTQPPIPIDYSKPAMAPLQSTTAPQQPDPDFVKRVLLDNPDQAGDIIMRSYPHTYAQYVTQKYEPDEQWRSARHLQFIGRTIAQAIAKGNGRVIVNLPPGCGKSSLISKWVPIWYLEHNPNKRVITCSYGSELAEYWGGMCREEITRNPNIRLKLRDDSRAKGQWITHRGGGMKAAGVGGAILGFRFNLGLIDDPIKDYQDAYSPVIRNGHKTWFESTFMTRAEPNATIVILMHRWHQDDLCGWLMREHPDEWTVIKLPQQAGPNDPLGRAPGEALWPERWPNDSPKIIEAKKTISWPSMYQQDPQDESGDRMYDRYKDDLHVVKGNGTEIVKDKDGWVGFTMDFNLRPGSHALVFHYDAKTDMMTFDHEFHGERWGTQEVMRKFIAWCLGRHQNTPATYDAPWEQIQKQINALPEGWFPWRYVNICGDRAGRTGNTATAMTDYKVINKMLRESKIPLRMCVPMHNPPIKDRVDTMNEALMDNAGNIHMRVNARCKRLIVDLATQPRDEDGKPDESNPLLGHAASAAGYSAYWFRPVDRQKFTTPQRAIT